MVLFIIRKVEIDISNHGEFQKSIPYYLHPAPDLDSENILIVSRDEGATGDEGRRKNPTWEIQLIPNLNVPRTRISICNTFH